MATYKDIQDISQLSKGMLHFLFGADAVRVEYLLDKLYESPKPDPKYIKAIFTLIDRYQGTKEKTIDISDLL